MVDIFRLLCYIVPVTIDSTTIHRKKESNYGFKSSISNQCNIHLAKACDLHVSPGSHSYVCRYFGSDLSDICPHAIWRADHHPGIRHCSHWRSSGMEIRNIGYRRIHPPRRCRPSYLCQFPGGNPGTGRYDRRIYLGMAFYGGLLWPPLSYQSPKRRHCPFDSHGFNRPDDHGIHRRPSMVSFIW